MTQNMENAIRKRDELLAKMENLVGSDEFENVEKQYKQAASLVNTLAEAENSAKSDDFSAANVAGAKKVDGFKLMVDVIKHKNGNFANAANLVTGGLNGEDYLVPEDVRLAINEQRKQYQSAKDLVTVISTTTLTGSFNYEKGTVGGLVSFTDGDDIDSSTAPEFERKEWKIEHKGKIIPVSNILLGAERASLSEYLNTWFTKNAVISENTDIFAKLKAGYKSGTPMSLANWKALRKATNKDLDPSVWYDGVIVTNQTGFDYLDSALDQNGRPILAPNPANPAEMRFNGKPVIVFSDTMLPNNTTKAPVIFGSLKAGCFFIDYQGLDFAASSDAGFVKNQTYMRVIEGYAVMEADTSAYIYGEIETAG